MASLDLQNKEFDAVEKLSKIYKDTIQSVAIVDDAYPEARFKYEGAVRDLVEAFKANGRIV